MPQSFFQFNDRLQKINPDRLIQDAVLLTGDKAILLNHDQLFNYGIGSDGKQLTPNYASFDYAEYKHNLNPSLGFGRVDLRETGAFYDSEELEVRGSKMIFNFTDSKASSLERKYGIRIGGLTKENQLYYGNQHVIPKIREEISSLTGLGFR